MKAKKTVVARMKKERAAGRAPAAILEDLQNEMRPAQAGLITEVDALIRLIDHAKKQGVSYFEGPGGLKFGFRREGPAPRVGAIPGRETGDDWIP